MSVGEARWTACKTPIKPCAKDAPASPTQDPPDRAIARTPPAPSLIHPNTADRSRPIRVLGRRARFGRQSTRPTAPSPTFARRRTDLVPRAPSSGAGVWFSIAVACWRQIARATDRTLHRRTPGRATLANRGRRLVTIGVHFRLEVALVARQQGCSVGFAAPSCQSLGFFGQWASLPMDGCQAGNAIFSPNGSRYISICFINAVLRYKIMARLWPNLGRIARFSKTAARLETVFGGSPDRFQQAAVSAGRAP